MIQQPNSLKTNLNRMIQNISSDKGVVDLFQVISYNQTSFTCVIKRLNTQVFYENVPIMLQGASSEGGTITPPFNNSIVVCAFLTNEPTPIILGSLYNKFLSNPQESVTVKQGEFVSKVGGSVIKQDLEGRVTINNEEGFLILNPDGSVTMNNFTFPKEDGSSGQVLKTNGNGVLTWQNDIVGGS